MSEKKRQKTGDHFNLNPTGITKFEQLPYELLLICFQYFDFFELYKSFSYLNQRINKLLLYQAKINVNFAYGFMEDENFLTDCFNLNQFITTSENYPLSIQMNDDQKFNLIMKDNLFKDKFSKLKSLTICKIKVESLYYALFNEKVNLCETLERLSLVEDIMGDENHTTQLFSDLISSKMKFLKYLNLNLQPLRCGFDHQAYEPDTHSDLKFQSFGQVKSSSQLETIIIGSIPETDYDANLFEQTKISFHTLTEDLLPAVPKLKCLMINAIHFDQDRHHTLIHFHQQATSATNRTNLMMPLNVKVIKLWTFVRSYKPYGMQPNEKLYGITHVILALMNIPLLRTRHPVLCFARGYTCTSSLH